jgi:hypothetical protein
VSLKKFTADDTRLQRRLSTQERSVPVTQVSAVDVKPPTSADATDLPSALTLLNELKATVNTELTRRRNENLDA